MADAAAEEAFINAMQNQNEAGVQGVVGTGSQQQADSDSDDEYDPAPAVQVDILPTGAQDISVPSPSVPVKHEALLSPSMSQVTAPSYANITHQDLPDTDIPNQSRSMSPDSAQLVKDPATIPTKGGGSPQLPATDISIVHTDTIKGDMANGDISDPASHTALSDSISTPNVLLQNGVLDRPSTEVVQNGVAPLNSAPLPFLSNTTAVAQSNITTEPQKAQSTTEAEAAPASKTATSPTTALPKTRLPHDRIGILEDRIKEDPRGDQEAWLLLIEEHRKRGKIDEARNAFERFFSVFPWAAEQWAAYGQMENEAENRTRLEDIFNRALNMIPSLQMWSMYLDHIRRTQNLMTDPSGTARSTVNSAYEFALGKIGIDKDAGKLWQDYIQFVKGWPGVIGDNSWQSQQKMDQLRKIYQQVICIPTQSISALWKEYDQFEMGLNKLTGRKFLQERSPSYMTARSSYTELQNITRDLRRTKMPVLPPAYGFDGHEEYMSQLEIWKRWISWEKEDPLVLKDEDRKAYRERVIYVYQQALMAMRFWPELWFDAAEFCFSEGMDTDGNLFLAQGTAANPESCLLAFKQADRIELRTTGEEGPEAAVRRGTAVREPYNKVLDALYGLITKAEDRQKLEITRIEAQHALQVEQQSKSIEDHDEDENNEADLANLELGKAANIEAVKNSTAAHVMLLRKTLTHAWIALMRAMRRVQGKGKVNDPIGGSRQIFTDARKRGRVTSDVYVSSAMIEFHCYEQEAARKIFDRGLKLFPDDEAFALEYIKHLVDINDHTNARSVFEIAVSKLAQKPETLVKAKPIYALFHDFESRYGELAQIIKLETRLRDLFPDDPLLSGFSRRFIGPGFDPTAIRPIVSPATQTRPKALPMPSIEVSTQQHTPPKPVAQTGNSPKRPLPLDESDTDSGRPSKMARGESPLKGAAGRRLDQHKRDRKANTPQYDGPSLPQPPPPSLPRDVLFFLSILPKANTFYAPKYKPEGIVKLLQDTYIPNNVLELKPLPGARGPPQQIPPHVQQPPQPSPHLAHMQHMQHIQHMPPMPPIPPPQYAQYNGHYPYAR